MNRRSFLISLTVGGVLSYLFLSFLWMDFTWIFGDTLDHRATRAFSVITTIPFSGLVYYFLED